MLPISKPASHAEHALKILVYDHRMKIKGLINLGTKPMEIYKYDYVILETVEVIHLHLDCRRAQLFALSHH